MVVGRLDLVVVKGFDLARGRGPGRGWWLVNVCGRGKGTERGSGKGVG